MSVRSASFALRIVKRKAGTAAIIATARKLGFLPITAAPEAVSEVDALYFLQPKRGKIVLRNKHRVGLSIRKPKP
jgi:hypothetical protein